MKYLKYTLLVLLLLTIGAISFGVWKFNNTLFKEKPNHLMYSAEDTPVQFYWANDTIGNIFETQVAMNIPVRFEQLPNQLHFQFDTGSPYSFIYEHDLESLLKMGLNFKEVKKDNGSFVQDLELILGGNKVTISMLRILKNYGNTFSEADTLEQIQIGTIGSDFMVDRVTEIDFKNQQIQFHTNRPDWMASLSSFQSFDFRGRRFMLPATINGKELELFYDSGCSAFGLITTKNRFDNYTDKATEIIAYDANGWGNEVPILHKMTDTKMHIGNVDLSLKRVSYVNMYTSTQRFVTPFTRIGGWLGNQPFNDVTLILDTKKGEFVVVESPFTMNTK